MREMIFINCVPDDLYFSWQEEVFIENVRRLGYTEQIRILVFLPHDRLAGGFRGIWKRLEERYSQQNVKFYYYPDTDNFLKTIREVNYIPLLRPYVLSKHFEEHPELQEHAIFYHDSDIVFTKYMDFEPFLGDQTNYVSDTKSYLNSDYLLSKYNDVVPNLQDLYKEYEAGILEGLASTCRIPFQTVIDNKDRTGGAQYLLKNIDAAFWSSVLQSCIDIRKYLNYDLGGINKKFFSSENAGFQSWCADMWAVLWNLWRRGDTTETPQAFDFAWATDTRERWSQVSIYHDAGVVGENTTYLFNKRSHQYINNISTPFQDDLSHVSKDYASSLYVDEILQVKQKYYNNRLAT